MVFDIGIRVVRGQNWTWGEQDGGEGCLGTVTDIGHTDTTGNVPPQCAAVQWDHGYRNTYRVGYDNQYDLRIFDTAAVGRYILVMGNMTPQCAMVQSDHRYRNTHGVRYDNQFNLRILDTVAVRMYMYLVIRININGH